MKIYVAGKFAEKDRVQEIQRVLRGRGHVITFDWTACEDAGLAGAYLDDYWRDCAFMDLQGVYVAEGLVLAPHQHGCGQYIELGAALAWDKKIVVIGTYEEWRQKVCFFALPQIRWAGDAAMAAHILEKWTE